MCLAFLDENSMLVLIVLISKEINCSLVLARWKQSPHVRQLMLDFQGVYEGMEIGNSVQKFNQSLQKFNQSLSQNFVT